jgi:hypothetical protein
MSEENWTTHIAAGAAWRRFGIMALLVPILGCVSLFVAFTALFQFFSVLAQGEPNQNLRRCGKDLSQYTTAIIDFLVYNTEHRPFPFAAGPDTAVKPERDKPTTAPAPRKKKTVTRKKTATRKKASTTRKTVASSSTRPTARTSAPTPDKPK